MLFILKTKKLEENNKNKTNPSRFAAILPAVAYALGTVDPGPQNLRAQNEEEQIKNVYNKVFNLPDFL